MPHKNVTVQRMDDPKEGGLLTPNGAAGLPTGSVSFFTYVAFLSLPSDSNIFLDSHAT